MFSKLSALCSIALSASHVASHGVVVNVVADGVTYQGYNPNFRFKDVSQRPNSVGWLIPKDVNQGFIATTALDSEDIICHIDASPGQIYATVRAGGELQFEWLQWIHGHNGPIITYLGNCNGDCLTVDKAKIKWNKIQEVGLLDPNPRPGKWATEQIFSNNLTSFATIPASIAPGKYIVRHEMIALHVAYDGGAQFYPQCINLEVTGDGYDSLPGGTYGQQFYKANDPGVFINLFDSEKPVLVYPIPGPPLYGGSKSSSGGMDGTGAGSNGAGNMGSQGGSPVYTTNPGFTQSAVAGATSAYVAAATPSYVSSAAQGAPSATSPSVAYQGGYSGGSTGKNSAGEPVPDDCVTKIARSYIA